MHDTELARRQRELNSARRKIARALALLRAAASQMASAGQYVTPSNACGQKLVLAADAVQVVLHNYPTASH